MPDINTRESLRRKMSDSARQILIVQGIICGDYKKTRIADEKARNTNAADFESPYDKWSREIKRLKQKYSPGGFDWNVALGNSKTASRNALIGIGARFASEFAMKGINFALAQAFHRDMPAAWQAGPAEDTTYQYVRRCLEGVAASAIAGLANARMTREHADSKVYRELCALSTEDVKTLSPETQALIAALDEEMLKPEVLAFEAPPARHTFAQAITLRHEYMSEPRHAIDTLYAYDREKADAISKKVRNILRLIPDPERLRIEVIVNNARHLSALPSAKKMADQDDYPSIDGLSDTGSSAVDMGDDMDMEPVEVERASVIYLQGPPGVGKSTIGRKLGIALGISPKHIHQIYAGAFRSVEALSEHMLALYLQGGIQNPIFILDEAGRKLMDPVFAEGLHHILESRQLWSPIQYRYVDISKAMMIWIGNQPMKPEFTPLASRMAQTHIPALDYPIRMEIAERLLQQKLESYQRIYHHMPEFVARLEQEARKYLEMVVHMDIQAFPGIRVLRDAVTIELVGYIMVALERNKPIHEHELKQYLYQVMLGYGGRDWQQELNQPANQEPEWPAYRPAASGRAVFIGSVPPGTRAGSPAASTREESLAPSTRPQSRQGRPLERTHLTASHLRETSSRAPSAARSDRSSGMQGPTAGAWGMPQVFNPQSPFSSRPQSPYPLQQAYGGDVTEDTIENTGEFSSPGNSRRPFLP